MTKTDHEIVHRKTFLVHAALPSLVILIASLFTVNAESRADTVYLKNGGRIEGIIKNENKARILIDIGFGTATLDKRKIKTIKRSTPQETQKFSQKWGQQQDRLIALDEQFKREREARFTRASLVYSNELREKKRKESSEGTVVQLIRAESDHLLVEALVNGRVKATFILDTGAPSVVISKKVGQDLGLDVSEANKDFREFGLAGQKCRGREVILESLAIENVELKNIQATLCIDDFEWPGLRDGLLGLAFLDQFNFKLDRKNLKLTLEEAKQ